MLQTHFLLWQSERRWWDMFAPQSLFHGLHNSLHCSEIFFNLTVDKWYKTPQMFHHSVHTLIFRLTCTVLYIVVLLVDYCILLLYVTGEQHLISSSLKILKTRSYYIIIKRPSTILTLCTTITKLIELHATLVCFLSPGDKSKHKGIITIFVTVTQLSTNSLHQPSS